MMHFNGVMMHFNGVVVVYTLFIVVGIWAILFPSGITKDAITLNYNASDLMRGWGIYATTIGALLAYPSYTRWILIVCFICSITWHMHIASRTTSLPAGWTTHHTHAVGLNGFAILLVLLH